MTNRFFERGRRVITFIKGFIVVFNLYPLCPKLSNVIVKSGPSANVRHNILECASVDHIQNWTKDMGNWLLMHTIKWRLGGNVNMEVFLDNVAFPINVGDCDDITQIGGLLYSPLCLARNDNVNAMCPHVQGILCLNPVARVKEMGTGGANTDGWCTNLIIIIGNGDLPDPCLADLAITIVHRSLHLMMVC